MEQSKIVALTKKLLRDYYEYGDIAELENMFSEDVIAFGIHSDSYATGKDRAAQCLRQMYYELKSCRVTKLKGMEKATDQGWAVRANLVFSTTNRMRNMHQVLVMFRDTAAGRKICGLHFQHDMRHELLYQAVSSRILNRGELADGSMDEVMDMVASYVNCAYVQYRPDQELPVDYYSEELWRMLGYKSGPAFGQQFAGQDILLERLVHPHDLVPSREEIKRQLLKSDSYQVEFRLRRADDSYIWCIECGRYVLDPKSGIGTFNAVITNLSPLKQTHASFLYNLPHVLLTNRYNKHAFCRRTA